MRLWLKIYKRQNFNVNSALHNELKYKIIKILKPFKSLFYLIWIRAFKKKYKIISKFNEVQFNSGRKMSNGRKTKTKTHFPDIWLTDKIRI